MNMSKVEIKYGTCDACGKQAEYLFFDGDIFNPKLCSKCCKTLVETYTKMAEKYKKAIDMIEQCEQADWEESQGGTTCGGEDF